MKILCLDDEPLALKMLETCVKPDGVHEPVFLGRFPV